MKEFILKHAEEAAEFVAFGLLKHKFKRLEQHHDQPSYERELEEFSEMFNEYLEAKK